MPLVTAQAATALEVEELIIADRPHGEASSSPIHPPRTALQSAAAVLALTLLAVLIDGYHPYSEDAGIYVASLKKLAWPGMYPSSGVFMEPYVRLSLFSHFGAWTLRTLHLPLETVLFQLHVATVFLLIYGTYEVARRCFHARSSIWGATLLIALCLSVPVAGTSLSIADPYLTGRSFSTPFTLFAICAVLDKSLWRTSLFLLLAVAFHPLMGAYAAGFLLILWAVERRSWLGIGALATGSLLAAAVIQFAHRQPIDSPAHLAAVATRTYFFLSEWQSYELLGIFAPLALLTAYALLPKVRAASSSKSLAATCVVIGLISVAISAAFCHPHSASQSIATLQPLRPFLSIYLVLFLVIGSLLGELILQNSSWRWLATAALLAICLGSVQHNVYPASPQLELPGIAAHNPWHTAFYWIRTNTPRNALFALDANYINAPGEDSLGFRAVAERDSLADYSKDGGAAAVFPQLAPRWLAEQTATTGLNQISDAERIHRLTPFHATWIILNHEAQTSFLCPFANDTVKVCQLP